MGLKRRLEQLLDKLYTETGSSFSGIFGIDNIEIVKTKYPEKEKSLSELIKLIIERGHQVNEIIDGFEEEYIYAEGEDISIFVIFVTPEVSIASIVEGESKFALFKLVHVATAKKVRTLLSQPLIEDESEVEEEKKPQKEVKKEVVAFEEQPPDTTEKIEEKEHKEIKQQLEPQFKQEIETEHKFTTAILDKEEKEISVGPKFIDREETKEEKKEEEEELPELVSLEKEIPELTLQEKTDITIEDVKDRFAEELESFEEQETLPEDIYELEKVLSASAEDIEDKSKEKIPSSGIIEETKSEPQPVNKEEIIPDEQPSLEEILGLENTIISQETYQEESQVEEVVETKKDEKKEDFVDELQPIFQNIEEEEAYYDPSVLDKIKEALIFEIGPVGTFLFKKRLKEININPEKITQRELDDLIKKLLTDIIDTRRRENFIRKTSKFL